MMKKKIIAIPAVALLLLAACATDNELPITPPDGEYPLIAARLQADNGEESSTNKPGTRASVTPDNDNLTAGEIFRWDKTDKLALTIADKATPGTGGTWQTFNIDPSFDPATAEKPGKADFTGNIPVVGKAGDVLYGLSPYKDGYGTNLAAVPLTVAAEQTQTNAADGATSTAHLGQSMLMYAKNTLTKDIAAANGASTALLPHLTFKHLCPLVRFRVRNVSTIAWRVTKIEMRHSTTTDNDKWFSTSATCDLTKADVVLKTTGRSRSMTLNIVNSKELPANTNAFEPGNHLNAYMALLPTVLYTGADTQDYLSICITAQKSSPSATQEMEYKVFYKDLKFLREGLKAGYRYYFSLSINGGYIELNGITVVVVDPWETVDGGDIGTQPV